jgi:hypothetical protein
MSKRKLDLDEFKSLKEEQDQLNYLMNDMPLFEKDAVVVAAFYKEFYSSKESKFKKQLQDKDKELLDKNKELQDKDKELQEKSQLKDEELNILKVKQVLTSSSTSHKFVQLLTFDVATAEVLDSFIALPEESKIVEAWLELSRSLNIPDDSVINLFTDEDRELHPVMEHVLKLLVIRFQSKCAYYTRYRLQSPIKIPDGVLTALVHPKPNWAELSAVFEYKLHPNIANSATEVAEYLYFMLPAAGSRASGFNDFAAIGSTFRQIMFFYVANNNVGQIKRSDVLPLFPDNWKALKQPTSGFRELVRIMNIKMPTSDMFIEVNKQTYKIENTVYESDGFGHYAINVNGEVVIVKKPKTSSKHIRGVLNLEIRRFMAMYAIPDFREIIIEPCLELTGNDCFATYAGETLFDWVARMKDEPDFSEILLGYYKQILKGLQLMFKNRWSHNDIRPKNIVIYKDTARFIDFVTAVYGERNGLAFMQQEYDPFWPTNEVCDDSGFKKDLFSFAFTMLFLESSVKQQENFIEHATRMQYLNSQTKGFGLVAKKIVDHLLNNPVIDDSTYSSILVEFHV